ncbi:PPC domain-containing protein [Pirellula sp. SH-Sr6A]|uniref:PPC domain-containing protein n=1 Tax=Pirellula sp. SH-Sr6A TaxID=1632865 RepID=UPI0011BA977D|nr:PPC domain-containing protein [Pirellula sp. SH-Sr6A]
MFLLPNSLLRSVHRFRSSLAAASFLTTLATTTFLPAAEKPQWTRLMPAGATAGASTPVDASGTFTSWPVQIWCSHPGVHWKCLEKAGSFEVSVNAGVRDQVAWVRLYNEAGATPAKPFYVSPRATKTEKEPNDRILEVTETLHDNEVTYGLLEKNGDVDHYRLALRAGEPFSATLDATRSLRSPLDAHLQLLDERGFVLTENLDRYGYDPGIAFQPKKDGTYYLRVFGFPVEPDSTISFRGGADWCYRLQWQRSQLPFDAFNAEGILLPSVAPEGPSPTSKDSAATVSLPLDTQRAILHNKETHFYRIQNLGGKSLEIQLLAQSIGSYLDATLTITNKEGKQVSFQDDDKTNRDPKLVWQVPDNEEYWVSVSDFHKLGSEDRVYRLQIRERLTSLLATAPAELKESKANEEFEWSIALERINNWTGDVEVLGVGLPADAVLTNTQFAVTKDGPKAHAVKVKLPTPWQGPFALQLKLAGIETPVTVAGPTQAGVWISNVVTK